jgi:hypothetical protein
MSLVVIGMDPHKRSATIEVMAGDEAVAGGGRYGTGAAGYAAMLAAVTAWPERIWAIEGCQGIGRHLANRLLADGEHVVDVPPKLSARLITDLERIYQRKKAANKELRDLLKATGSTLTSLHGIGPSGAARLLVEAGDITRFPSEARFASWSGTAPIDALPVTRSATACPGQATAGSTAPCTSWPSSSSAPPPKAAPTTTAKSLPGKHRWKRCAPSNGGSPTSPTTR